MIPQDPITTAREGQIIGTEGNELRARVAALEARKYKGGFGIRVDGDEISLSEKSNNQTGQSSAGSGIGATTTFYRWQNGVVVAYDVEATNPRIIGSL